MKHLQNENLHRLFLLYELGHVEELQRYLRKNPDQKNGSFVIALSTDIEQKLTESDIVFVSGRDYKKVSPDLLTNEDRMIDAFFRDPRWATFTYRGVKLQATFLYMFRAYFKRAWYYGSLLVSIAEAHEGLRSIILFAPSSDIVFDVAGGLARREVNAVADCAKIIAAARGIPVSVIPTHRPALTTHFLFSTKQSLFSLFLKGWNAMIAVLIRPRRPCLVISDYWRNIGSSVELLKEGECIFLDRTEIWHIPWRMLLRYRMRFVHAEDFLSRIQYTRASEGAREFGRMWTGMRESMTPVFNCRGYALDSLFLRAMDDIVSGFEKTLCQIEGVHSLYKQLQPDIVILRASVSGQTHFSVLPLVAKEYGIPSLELQHGLENFGAGSLSREHLAEYMAVYGSLVKKELVTIGFAPEKVREIGSPRFDTYLTNRTHVWRQHTSSNFVILCIAPDVDPFDIRDSYSAEYYFNSIAKATWPIKNAHVIIKLRFGPAGEGLLRTIVARTFARVSHDVAQSESLSDLFARTDAVVSCYSTTVLEALQCGMPVIIPALNSIEANFVNFHFSRYQDAHALYIAYTQADIAEMLAGLVAHPSLRSEMRANALAFLSNNFCFDGKSAERCASFITELADLR